MKREELFKISKPILFNTEMVQAILEGRKTVTRRTVKLDLGMADTDKHDSSYLYIPDNYGDYHHAKDWCKYQPGDILYVRETWNINPAYHFNKNFEDLPKKENKCIFKADYPDFDGGWKPSIHMPKKLARIFLKVTDVRVERLQDIKDGWRFGAEGIVEEHGFRSEMIHDFVELWNSTIKKQDLGKYGWEANPWVFVIDFEVIE